MTEKKKEQTTYPVGPLSYTRMLQVLKEALSQEMRSYGLDPSEREVRRLLWRDDMENYVFNKWSTMIMGTSIPAYVNNEIPAFEGDSVLSIRDPASTASSVGVGFGLLPKVKNSVELRWYKNASLRTMVLYFHLYDGVYDRACDIRWSSYDNRWEYRGSDGGFDNYPALGGGEKIGNDTWNYLKLIGDFENNRYSRLITTGLDVDMSSIPLYTVPSAETPWTNLSLIVNAVAPNTPGYFDDVRIYLNEV